MIHPQAIIDPRARLGKDVQVGAYSIIGADVEIGDRCWIGPHVVINGPTRIGADSRVYQFCSLGDAPQHTGYKGEPTRLEIGERNVVREYCTFNRGTVAGGGLTQIGNDNFIMAYSHIAHDCRIGNHTVFANAASLAGHVHIGDYAVLGGFTLVHQFCRIGAYCMTAVNTVLFKDVPPFVTAGGNSAAPHGINVRGLRRRGFGEAGIAAIRRAYKTLYKSGLLLEQALAEIDTMARAHPELTQLTTFIRESERGIIR
ncbi:MAG: acyl-ACP--UDP-N-acetylglucosamine O-acyltransferase [Gammaproteobacteria bacterium]